MSRDLTVAWELLTAVTRAQQQIATARHQIWEKARLPTAEHTFVVTASADGERWQRSSATGPDQVVLRIALETHLKDGRRLTSCLDIVIGPTRWRTMPYITLPGGAAELLWEGRTTEKDDPAGLVDIVDSATRNLLDATMSLDLSAIDGQ
jgi:hypothetical protein